MIKVLFIAPYHGLAEIVRKYHDFDKELLIDTKVGNLEEGIQAAREAESEGYDLIISRGGTARQIEDEVSIPVVDVKISGYDMLRIFALLKNMDGKSALVGFPNISQGASTICNILDMDVRTITIESRKEVTELLADLKEEGYSVIIGDVVTVRQAEQHGLQGILITSGKEAVIESFQEAKRLYQMKRKIQAQSFLYNEVFEHFPYPIVTLNQDQQVILANDLFRELEGSLDKKVVSSMIEKEKEKEKESWGVMPFGDKTYFVLGYPHLGGDSKMTFVFQERWLKEREGIAVLTNSFHIPISGSSHTANTLRENLKSYSELDRPIWIEGKPGTGKTMYARNLHFERYGQMAPLLMIDFAEVETDEATRLFQTEGMLLPNEASIVLKNIHRADKSSQLRSVVQELSKKYKIIILSEPSIQKMVEDDEFDFDLYYKLPSIKITLPDLSERIEDIKEMVQAFISWNHMNYGYEAIGIRGSALAELRNHSWRGNIAELKQVVDQLAMDTSEPYITKENVVSALGELGEGAEGTDVSSTIVLQGTLKEMEKQIINKVMEEENHNQSKVAQRLGMNRTTLWRKLNS
ncbi:sigma-54-dependent Fis family transcriptional regulator [Halobacillus salinus]|uniref:Sigma-54-dependent Fis family transcriptional regulator n=1 Tax=Halobacillus salinus TaxID=192814 RepID=A0A4Z0GXH8_9BACI|nr:sigma-54-dependent Fis family transcriptional regulator [Halobacillus salinus]TGB02445.1 sigma-54-dependent Fis family transcriptional regulator [Halobacillus salinus]